MRNRNPLARQGIACLVAAIVAIVSWTFGYRPVLRAYVLAQEQSRLLTSRLSELERMVAGSGGAPDWLAMNQDRLERLKERWASRTRLPHLLDTLARALSGSKLKLIDVTQGNLMPILEAGTPVRVDGRRVYRLPVTVTAEGRFHAIVAALRPLVGGTFPSPIVVDHVELEARSSSEALLRALITVQLFVVEDASSDAPPASTRASRRPSSGDVRLGPVEGLGLRRCAVG